MVFVFYIIFELLSCRCVLRHASHWVGILGWVQYMTNLEYHCVDPIIGVELIGKVWGSS